VATDIAARGLDISQLPHVVNYELPNVAEDYIHRIGRTGRAGNEGEAMSLVCVDELDLLKDIERLIKREIPRDVVAGFEPDPSIKASPSAKGSRGRGKQQASTRAGGKKQTSRHNKQRPPFKAKSTNKGGSKKRSSNRRSSTGGASQPRSRQHTRQAA
jgi:ATP-dependent RNA helicase RhlE